MALIPIFLDFETYWDQDHTLSKMSAIEYVMHPKTEIQSVSIQVGMQGGQHTHFGEEEIRRVLNHIDWSRAWVIAHNNSEFDAMILAWRFGIKPRMWGCTLAMARPIHAKTCGLSLRALAEFYGLEEKGSLEIVNTKGKMLHEFTADERAKMRTYNDKDTRLCSGLFAKLVPQVSRDELRTIDMTMRMLVEPQFDVNVDLLERGLRAEKKRKERALDKLGDMLQFPGWAVRYKLQGGDPAIDIGKQLKSTKKFRELLESMGVDVPMKESPTTGRMIPALAKTDQAFLDLQEHPNELVAAAASTRLNTQSSILETRMQRFINVAKMCDGKMPIALRYAGADTTWRWSGIMKLNHQNLPRINPGKAQISDVLRKSLIAPPGYEIVVADLSGIELRVNMFLWKVPYAMKLFRDDPAEADLYKHFAANELYGIPIADVEKWQRQVGKVAHLGLGFGAGWMTFKTVAKLMGGVDLDDEESKRIVEAYRKAHIEIKKGWRTCHAALDFIHGGMKTNIDPWGMCHTSQEGIVTPKGLIRYPKLHQEVTADGADWWYGTTKGRGRARIYAGKIDENIVQHLARHVINDVALAMHAEFGKHYPLAHTVHDELIYVVKKQDAKPLLDHLQGLMRTPPAWWPELITWSEGDIAETYGDAK